MMESRELSCQYSIGGSGRFARGVERGARLAGQRGCVLLEA